MCSYIYMIDMPFGFARFDSQTQIGPRKGGKVAFIVLINIVRIDVRHLCNIKY